MFHDFGIGPLSLPRRMYRPRAKSMERTYNVDKGYLEGRRYEDWLDFRERNPGINEVQIDSVMGGKGSDCCLFTIHFTDSHLILAYPRRRNSADNVREAFDSIWDAIGPKAFIFLFPAILTDNGSEFSDPLGIELNRRSGLRKTRVFYCHSIPSGRRAPARSTMSS